MIFFYLKNILFFDRLLQNPLFIRHFVTHRYLISQLSEIARNAVKIKFLNFFFASIEHS